MLLLLLSFGSLHGLKILTSPKREFTNNTAERERGDDCRAWFSFTKCTERRRRKMPSCPPGPTFETTTKWQLPDHMAAEDCECTHTVAEGQAHKTCSPSFICNGGDDLSEMCIPQCVSDVRSTVEKCHCTNTDDPNGHVFLCFIGEKCTPGGSDTLLTTCEPYETCSNNEGTQPIDRVPCRCVHRTSSHPGIDCIAGEGQELDHNFCLAEQEMCATVDDCAPDAPLTWTVQHSVCGCGAAHCWAQMHGFCDTTGGGVCRANCALAVILDTSTGYDDNKCACGSTVCNVDDTANNDYRSVCALGTCFEPCILNANGRKVQETCACGTDLCGPDDACVDLTFAGMPHHGLDEIAGDVIPSCIPRCPNGKLIGSGSEPEPVSCLCEDDDWTGQLGEQCGPHDGGCRYDSQECIPNCETGSFSGSFNGFCQCNHHQCNTELLHVSCLTASSDDQLKCYTACAAGRLVIDHHTLDCACGDSLCTSLNVGEGGGCYNGNCITACAVIFEPTWANSNSFCQCNTEVCISSDGACDIVNSQCTPSCNNGPIALAAGYECQCGPHVCSTEHSLCSSDGCTEPCPPGVGFLVIARCACGTAICSSSTTSCQNNACALACLPGINDLGAKEICTCAGTEVCEAHNPHCDDSSGHCNNRLSYGMR